MSMTNVLLGTLGSSPAAAAIGDRYRAAGGDPENDLKNGRTVLVVRNVDSRQADEEGRRLQRLGVFHLHYSGRWTSVEHGLVPTPRATSMSTTS